MVRTRLVSNASGFTLIEVLVSIAIFSIGLMAMGALQTRTLMDTGNVSRKTEAWTLLEEQAERIKQLRFYIDDPPVNFDPDLTAGAHALNSPDGRYTFTWQIADDVPIPQANATQLPGVPAGNYTVSKTITLTATRFGGGIPMAQMEFVKVWWATGIP